MRNLSRLLMAAALVALAVPALASAAPTTRGVVVQRDTRAGAIVLATQSGTLARVQSSSPSRFSMGDVVQLSGSKLRLLGHSHRARVHGVVLHRSHGSYALAGNGSVLAVNSQPRQRSGSRSLRTCRSVAPASPATTATCR